MEKLTKKDLYCIMEALITRQRFADGSYGETYFDDEILKDVDIVMSKVCRIYNSLDEEDK